MTLSRSHVFVQQHFGFFADDTNCSFKRSEKHRVTTPGWVELMAWSSNFVFTCFDVLSMKVSLVWGPMLFGHWLQRHSKLANWRKFVIECYRQNSSVTNLKTFKNSSNAKMAFHVQNILQNHFKSWENASAGQHSKTSLPSRNAVAA